MGAGFRVTPAGLGLGGTVSGNLIITGTLNVQGAVTFDVAQTTTGLFNAEGGILIDETGTEVLLVRQEADAGDAFAVDTTNLNTTVNGRLTVDGAGSGYLVDVSGSLFASSTATWFGVTGLTPTTTNYTFLGDATQTLINVPTGGKINFMVNNVSQGFINTAGLVAEVPIIGDVTATEALLVRKNADAGDVFAVDTTNVRILVGTPGSDSLDETPLETLSVIGGSIETYDAGTLASESLQDGAFAGFTKWTDAGDFNEGTTAYDYLDSTNAGTLTQALADLTIAGKNNRWYKFTYTISNFAGAAVTATITSAFALAAVTLDFSSNATRSVVFQSAVAADAADFVISVVSVASDAFTIDDLVLKEITGGDLIVAGKITGGGTVGVSVDGDGQFSHDSNVVINTDGQVVSHAPSGAGAITKPQFTHAVNLSTGVMFLDNARFGFTSAGNYVFQVQNTQIQMSGNSALAWTSGDAQTAAVLELNKEANDTLSIRRATNAGELEVYNTWTSTTNNELAEFGWLPQANILTIGTKKGSGGGTARPLSIRTDEVEAINITTGQLVRLGVLGTDGIDEATPEILTVNDGNIEVRDSGTLAAESFTDGAFPNTTNWAGAGEWSDTISGAAIFTFASTGNGTMTQAQADLAISGKNNRWYKLTYTTSSVVDAGGLTLSITNAFAAASVPLTTADGTYSVIFQSNAAADAADFVFDITGASGSDVLTLDDVILKEIIGGDLIVAGAITGGGANGMIVDGDGGVRIAPAGVNDGHVHILSPATGTNALVCETPSGSTQNQLELHLDGTAVFTFTGRAASQQLAIGTGADMGNDVRGPGIQIQKNTGVGAEGNAPAYMLMTQADAGGSYFWWKDDGDLVVHTAAATGNTGTPTVDANTAGTVVGTQTSPKAIKNILYTYKADDQRMFTKLQAVLDTPIHDFNFKSGKYNQDFTGLAVPDGEHPWYGASPSPNVGTLHGHEAEVPAGTAKYLNEMNIPGYLILSVKALNAKIERLEALVEKLLEG